MAYGFLIVKQWGPLKDREGKNLGSGGDGSKWVVGIITAKKQTYYNSVDHHCTNVVIECSVV